MEYWTQIGVPPGDTAPSFGVGFDSLSSSDDDNLLILFLSGCVIISGSHAEKRGVGNWRLHGVSRYNT